VWRALRFTGLFFFLFSLLVMARWRWMVSCVMLCCLRACCRKVQIDIRRQQSKQGKRANVSADPPRDRHQLTNCHPEYINQIRFMGEPSRS
jgi:hypothetical protein